VQGIDGLETEDILSTTCAEDADEDNSGEGGPVRMVLPTAGDYPVQAHSGPRNPPNEDPYAHEHTGRSSEDTLSSTESMALVGVEPPRSGVKAGCAMGLSGARHEVSNSPQRHAVPALSSEAAPMSPSEGKRSPLSGVKAVASIRSKVVSVGTQSPPPAPGPAPAVRQTAVQLPPVPSASRVGHISPPAAHPPATVAAHSMTREACPVPQSAPGNAVADEVPSEDENDMCSSQFVDCDDLLAGLDQPYNRGDEGDDDADYDFVA
jgi:hypothetical protein